MPKTSKRNIKLPATKPATAAPAKPVTATAIPTAAVAKPVNSERIAERRAGRDAAYLARAAYTTDAVTPATASYLGLFATAAKAGNGSFHTSAFDPKAANNPESPKRNFRARAKLLADHGILRNVAGDTFTFTDAVTAKAAPTNAPAHILQARTAYHGKA